MFADLAYTSRTCPKTPGCHCLGVGGKSATKLSKILVCLRYKAKPDLVIDLTKVGSTLSLEEHQLHAWRWSAFSGTHKIAECERTSTKIRKFFARTPAGISPQRQAKTEAGRLGRARAILEAYANPTLGTLAEISMKRTIVHLAVIVCIAGFVHADETVRSVQQSLKDQGLYYGNITGDKSAETSAAIRRYQIRSGLKVTGDVDPETLRSLNVNSNLASSQPDSKSAVTQSHSVQPDQSPRIAQNTSPQSFTEPDRQPEPNQVLPGAPNQSVPHQISKRMAFAEVQRQLISRGYYRGHIDGKYGRQTAFALRAFQSGAGLPPTGHLDISTLNALGLSDQNLAYLEPARRSPEVWVPITKFKHGKWKVKWKKYHRENGDEYGDDRGLNEDIGWNRDDDND